MLHADFLHDFDGCCVLGMSGGEDAVDGEVFECV